MADHSDTPRHHLEHTDSHSSTSSIQSHSPSINDPDETRLQPAVHSPIPKRPYLPNRQSSGTMVISRDSCEVVESRFGPDDARAMSPRRSSQEVEWLGLEAKEELKKHAKALQESLLTILNRIEAVREEHDKLDSHNKFLQKYIGDLMTTSKLTATGGRAKK